MIFNLKLSKRLAIFKFFIIFFALIVSFIPWDKIRSAPYYDRTNYINYIDFYQNKIYWFDFSGILSKISNEWLWHYILNFFNNTLGFSSKEILWLISLIFIIISFLILFSKTKNIGFILVLNPIFIDFFYSQVRLCFAISFLYISIIIFHKNKFLGILFLIPAFFIHTSTILFSFIFYSAYILSNTEIINNKFKIFISIFVGIIISLLTGPYMSVILSSIEDRRAEYNDMSSPVSYMSFWILFYLYLIFKMFKGGYNYYYNYISLSILTMIFLNIFISGYPSRFLAATIPFIIISLLNIKGRDSLICWSGYIMYFLMLWFFWVT